MMSENEIDDFLAKMSLIIDKDEKKRKSDYPRALTIQKQKFLCAIGKAEPSPTEEKDEAFVKESFDMEKKNTFFHIHKESLLWKDTIATGKVNEILKKHQNFEISLYLDCAKAIYLTYSGKINSSENFYQALIYVITHARLFGDPAQSMFQLESNGSFEISFEDLLNPLSDSIYMRKITALINGLQTEYDETKYQILNVNVTYLALLILRRFIKKDNQFSEAFKRINTHDDYVKLCPHPLYNQLPKIAEAFNKNIHSSSLITPVQLAIHAFVTTNDAITKRVLRATCLQHIEWNGLHLPKLFFQVANLYGIEEGELWDSLCFNGTYKSLFKLSNDYYKQYKMSKADPPEAVAWFPYCRALYGKYHRDLSASENKDLCMLLAFLVDLKKGFQYSSVRNSHWAQNLINKDEWLKIAKAFHKKYNKPQLL